MDSCSQQGAIVSATEEEARSRLRACAARTGPDFPPPAGRANQPVGVCSPALATARWQAPLGPAPSSTGTTRAASWTTSCSFPTVNLIRNWLGVRSRRRLPSSHIGCQRGCRVRVDPANGPQTPAGRTLTRASPSPPAQNARFPRLSRTHDHREDASRLVQRTRELKALQDEPNGLHALWAGSDPCVHRARDQVLLRRGCRRQSRRKRDHLERGGTCGRARGQGRGDGYGR
ncbi:MAG: hypothetical protein JWN52_4390 [Actinomycetia bacterium]|jgi:hypothetical protein|nr:hypothetical protein [Actinomycetes bacterium]